MAYKGVPSTSDDLHEPASTKGVSMEKGPMKAQFKLGKGAKANPLVGRKSSSNPFKLSQKSSGGPK